MSPFRIPITVLLSFLALAVVAAFFLGKWYGSRAADAGGQRAVTLTEDMVILTAGGQPKGLLPAGTTMYVVPDPWADRTTLFKVFLQTDVNDEKPLRPTTTQREHRFQQHFYPLKSQEWLRVSTSPTPTEK